MYIPPGIKTQGDSPGALTGADSFVITNMEKGVGGGDLRLNPTTNSGYMCDLVNSTDLAMNVLVLTYKIISSLVYG